MRRSWLPIAALILAVAGLPGLAVGQALASTPNRPHASPPPRSPPHLAPPRPGPPPRSPRHLARPRTLLVCNGSTTPCPALAPGRRQYQTVQAAVDAASPGDWVLIWPGVYHEKNRQWSAGVWITKPGLHIRGLNRNKVIIDGSNGTATHPCPAAARLQDYTARDGIVVWKASGVSIENLTVCDYLSGRTGRHGNEIWWNGGDASGKIGLGAYHGSYLTATSMYGPKPAPTVPQGQYGIFVSNSSGPGLIDYSYASNMADAAYYVGACRRACDTLLAHDRGTNSSLGYSGTNAGGRLIIRDSLFDHNRTGLAPNSLNNDDAPPPQDGRCPRSTSRSCMIIENNVIERNNNANAPTEGYTPAVGTGIEISGGKFDTVRDNLIRYQGAWGVITHDFPDPEKPPRVSHCQGGFPGVPATGYCLFPARGNRVYGNRLAHNGFFGNATNGDLATEALIPQSPAPRNCFYGNRSLSGKLTSAPARIQSARVDGPPCGRRGTGNDVAIFEQLICATGFTTCPLPPKDARYPKQTKITIVPLPRLPTMPRPCAGVPRNGYCE